MQSKVLKLATTRYYKFLLGVRYYEAKLVQYFPTDFELDVLAGEKFIYSEPILPELNDVKILRELEGIKLTKTEENRNKLNYEPIVITI